jgi:hypothetical protein
MPKSCASTPAYLGLEVCICPRLLAVLPVSTLLRAFFLLLVPLLQQVLLVRGQLQQVQAHAHRGGGGLGHAHLRGRREELQKLGNRDETRPVAEAESDDLDNNRDY